MKYSLFIPIIFMLACNGLQENQKPKAMPQHEWLLDSAKYYETYSGHEISHLEMVYQGLKHAGCTNFIFYAGDSSLDNKYWVKNSLAEAINGYEAILVPPEMVMDVDYWMNKLLSENGYKEKKTCSIMTAVEASTLRQREQTLLPQDLFVQSHLSQGDYLIVSVGGNDIALAPTEATSRALAELRNNPKDQQSIAHLLAIVSEKTKNYIEKLIEKNMPKKILICMIYYPQEASAPSWANNVLDALSYSKDSGASSRRSKVT